MAGVVVRTARSRREMERRWGVRAWTGLAEEALRSADAFVVATPSGSHGALVRRCLAHGHVLAEKPLAMRSREAASLGAAARRRGRTLMTGHILRFDPLGRAFLRAASRLGRPRAAQGEFITPLSLYRTGERAPFECLHLVDILDAAFGREPELVWARSRGRVTSMDLRYPGGWDARLRLGWEGDARHRRLRVDFARERLTVDLVARTLARERGGKSRVVVVPPSPEPLKTQMLAFLSAVRRGARSPVGSDVAARVLRTCERSEASPPRRRPKVAVIGGGIFGATTALVLAKRCDVTLFERHDDVLFESSWGNQLRHHMGYHYPRSRETIAEILGAEKDFDAWYGKAVLRYPSYYGVARHGSKTSPEGFLALCKEMGLPARPGYPAEGFLNRKEVALGVRTPEAAYDFDALKALVERRLRSTTGLTLRLGTEVTGASLGRSGDKALTWRGRSVGAGRFDHVVNATYANYNRFSGWLGFPPKKLRHQLKELIVVDFGPVPPVSVTVVDGPFSTLIPLGRTGLFTLGDVALSIHRTPRKFDAALMRRWEGARGSHWERMRAKCGRWFPALATARKVRSMYTVYCGETVAGVGSDERRTDLREHGFGCYSILAGKIVTCVTTAKQILSLVQTARP